MTAYLTVADDLMVLEVDIWIDKWEIEGGDSLFEKINEGIEKSQYIALLFSSSFITKKWSSAEVKAAFSKEVEKGQKVILPLILEKVNLPPLLRDKLYLSFEEDYYNALARLAGVIHGLSSAEIDRAVRKKQPKTLEEAVDTLVYAGKDPYMIIPQDVFEELAESGHADVDMLQGRSVFRDDLVNRGTGQGYKAWNVYQFDKPKDRYGNYTIKQFGENYGTDMVKELAGYKIKELEDPKKAAQLIDSLKDGNRPVVTVTGADGQDQKLRIEAMPRYGNYNFFELNGDTVKREQFLKEPKQDLEKGQANIFERKLEQQKQQGMSV